MKWSVLWLILVCVIQSWGRRDASMSAALNMKFASIVTCSHDDRNCSTQLSAKQLVLVTARAGRAACLMARTCKQFSSGRRYILPFVSHPPRLLRPVNAGPLLSLAICINVYRGVKVFSFSGCSGGAKRAAELSGELEGRDGISLS